MNKDNLKDMFQENKSINATLLLEIVKQTNEFKTLLIEQNNKIVEAIEFASDSYWGDPNRFKFKANIDNFSTTTLLEQGQDRAAKSTFNIKLFGYIIPDTVNKDLVTARSKFYTQAQVIFDIETTGSL
jgi:hypothetical protein